MQPKLCSRCHKNVAVVFITRLDKGDPVNEGLCLKCAKELGIKEKDFIGWLLDHRYVYRDQKNKLMPYAAKNNGLFEVKEGKGRHNDWTGTQTLITPKGRETFRLLCKDPPVLPQFTTL